MTLNEAHQFVSACQEKNVYPRLERYVNGPIHIQTEGRTECVETLPGTAIYGVWIDHGPTTDMSVALKLVTADTKILGISLKSYWGSVRSIVPDATPYGNVEGLTLDGPLPNHNATNHNATRFRYSNNHCISFINGIDLTHWTRLVNLSLPALALQHAPVDGIHFLSACVFHIGRYDMTVLERLTTLKALAITQWLSCTGCHIHPDVMFETGLARIPPNVEYISISGEIGYYEAEIPKWLDFHPAELRRILRINREDVLVCCGELYIVRLRMYPMLST